MAKFRKELYKTGNVTSANGGFRTKNHCVATYEQTKKGLSYLYPKRVVESDRIHFFLWKSKNFIYEVYVQIYTT